MQIAITGGTGLIGPALARSLVSAGHQVKVLSRNPDRHRALATPGLTLAAWSPARSGELAESLAGCEAVVNLAGAGVADARWTVARKDLIRSSRVEAGRALVQAFTALGAERPAHLIQAAAVGYYGAGRTGPLSEDAAPGQDFLASVCQDWEASTAGVEALGVRRAVARIGIVLSLEGGAFPKMLLPFRLFVGGPLGSGRQAFPWVHITDVVGALEWLIARPDATGPFNLAAPEAVDNAGFSKALGRALHRPSLLPAPAPALRLALGEMATMLLDGQPAVPTRLLAAGYPFRFPRLDGALKDLVG